MNTNGMRELNLDEMNNVSGGAEFASSIELLGITVHDDESLGRLLDYISILEGVLGKSGTEDFLKENCPANCYVVGAYMQRGIREVERSLRKHLGG